MTKQEEIEKLGRALGFTDFDFTQSPEDWNGPAEHRGCVDIGQCPFSFHFYDYTLDGACDQALEWLRKPKPKCGCDW